MPPHHKCVSTLPCEIWMKYAFIMIITNILVKLKKKHFSSTLQWMICIRIIIHRNVLKCLSFTLMFVIIVRFSYIYVSQGSVKTHLVWWVCNNHIIANCRQCAVKEFWKSVINWWKYGQKQSDTFFMAHGVYVFYLQVILKDHIRDVHLFAWYGLLTCKQTGRKRKKWHDNICHRWSI